MLQEQIHSIQNKIYFIKKINSCERGAQLAVVNLCTIVFALYPTAAKGGTFYGQSSTRPTPLHVTQSSLEVY